MRNQIEAAHRLKVNAQSINSDNTDDWDSIKDGLIKAKIDLLLVSPERLANEDFVTNVLSQVANRVGLFVVDEAHCISDWGHDFRPDYKRITRILQGLPRNIPVLATTATANNRVVKDVVSQLGRDIQVLRGPLVRKSLRLQNIMLPDQAARLAWLASVLPRMPGSGIVYTLTVKDAVKVADWLKSKGINAKEYHANVDSRERIQREQQLLNNQIKALVATTALGMGFDKPDLGFVIHYQRPGSVVHYYQQVGRAGRAVDRAYGVLLSGDEDQEITDYFISTAFPPIAHTEGVLRALSLARDGTTIFGLMHSLNLSHSQIDKVLKLLSLESPSPVSKIEKKWYRTAAAYRADPDTIERLTQLRRTEQSRMLDYVNCPDCLMAFLSKELDDPEAVKCGMCASCAGRNVVPVSYPLELAAEASEFIRQSVELIEPKKMWAPSSGIEGFKGKIPEELRASAGRALSMWGDGGWGDLVRRGKQVDGRFDDRLVEAAADLLWNRWTPASPPMWIACVPSITRPALVSDFARRLAIHLKVPFRNCIVKTMQTRPQKLMNNNFQQLKNIAGAFSLDEARVLKGPVLLVDDLVDSGWTFTVIASILRKAGVQEVYPFALAKLYLSKDNAKS
jgi:ATP-dependent DNA helicase RecQ